MSGFKQVSKAQARRHMAVDERIERMAEAPLDLIRREEFVHEIATLWRSAQERFLLIGRYLVQARSRLPHGEFQAMVENELPFGYQVAYQLRMVAEAVDSGRLPGTKLPPSYATVYQLATLTTEQLRLADQRNLIRPDVTRPEIVRFKRDLRQAGVMAAAGLPEAPGRREALLAERERLRARLAAVEAELAEQVGG
ncbi:sulfite reductase beta subunit-like hemoprotein [Azospirillum agricola]|uniref:hypothetical protein n=1 Tax=Azospirillum agricola TaxID=1720247 RepID=UPI001AE3F468|nr:hypothetical protein [Azospirillum agricola]MBP2230138.1 sulfite reductase beta subunit-like hemoprotein [Azospirillum agricola]